MKGITKASWMKSCGEWRSQTRYHAVYGALLPAAVMGLGMPARGVPAAPGVKAEPGLMTGGGGSGTPAAKSAKSECLGDFG